MGQTQTQLKQNEDYRLIEELPVGNIVKHTKTQSMHFLKQYSFTAQQAYQNALNAHSLKLANKNQHILNFLHFTTKSQNSFCSTFHKIILIFEYIDYSLEKQIQNRMKDNRPFNQKQMWSVLCSCVLAAVHLIHCEGRMHCGLTARDIRLSPSGCVKLLSHQMIGIDPSHSQCDGTPKMLALTIMQCMLLQKLTNQDPKYLQNTVQSLDCSRDMKDMLVMMIGKDVKFTELEEHLFKLVQDDQSLASNSNTPILKSQSPLNSNYKCPKIYRNQDKPAIEKQIQHHSTESDTLPSDYEDMKSHLFQCPQPEMENPDQTEQQNPQHQLEAPDHDSPQKINSFYLKQRKVQSNVGIDNQFGKDIKEIQNIKITKSYEIGTLQSSRRQQNTQNMTQFVKKQVITKTTTTYNSGSTLSQNQQNLFTDPKLFSLIRNDLEQIKMRRSIGQLGKFTRTQQSKTSLKLEQEHETSNKNEDVQKQVYSLSKAINLTVTPSIEQPQSHMSQQSSWFKQQQLKTANTRVEPYGNPTGFKQIEMIKEVSQEYRQDDQEIKQRRSSIRQVQKLDIKESKKSQSSKSEIKSQFKADNIMNDADLGFKKKKQSTGKFEVSKQTSVQPQSSKAMSEVNYKKDILKAETSGRGVKEEQKYEQQKSSKTVGMKPSQNQLNTQSNRHQQFFNNYSRSHSQSRISSNPSNRIHQKAEKDDQKLVYVNQKYNRGRYEGTKLNGKRHGTGTFYYSEGGKYVGSWKQNKMHGRGILYYPNQQVAYDGEWENDQLSGYGTLYNQQVSPLRSPFDYRDWSDVEDYWVKYQGHFYQDNKQGQGKLFLVNGQRLEGEYHDDKVDGEGILYRGDGSCVKGKWRQNKLIRMF